MLEEYFSEANIFSKDFFPSSNTNHILNNNNNFLLNIHFILKKSFTQRYLSSRKGHCFMPESQTSHEMRIE